MRPVPKGRWSDTPLLSQRVELFADTARDSAEKLEGYRVILEGIVQEALVEEVSALSEKARLAGVPEEEYVLWRFPAHYEDFVLPHLRGGFLVLAVATVENYLDWACQDAQAIRRLDEPLKKARNEAFVKACQRYLIQEAGWSAGDSNDWDGTARAYQIRNSIAHGGAFWLSSRLSSERELEKLRERLASFQGIRVDEHEVCLEIDESFPHQISNLVKRFLDYLAQEQTALMEGRETAEQAAAAHSAPRYR